MAFNLLYQLKNKESLWMDVVFYFVVTLLIVVVFSFGIFVLKIYLQNQKISEVDKMMALYGTREQKMAEKEVFDYKKKIDDFTAIIASRKISLNVLTFIEEKTLPNVWFSDFDMSGSINRIRLSGESENMETFGRQVQVFEKSHDYIKEIIVLDSQLDSTGKIKFAISFSLDPKIFAYVSQPLPAGMNLPGNATSNP